MKPLFNSMLPFLILGMVVVASFSLLLLFFHIMLWGILLGVVFWAVMAIKLYFFKPKTVAKGQTYDNPL